MKRMRKDMMRFLLVALVSVAGCLMLGNLQSARAAGDYVPVKARPEVLLPPDSDALAWRYDMKMGSFCGGCAGYVYELNTPELIERRVKEMQAQGYNTLCISGFHMHHCFLERWPRITRHMKEVSESAHRHGMKVIFHHDVPVLMHNEKGLHELVKHPDWLARDIEHDRPTLRCYCIINPGFRKAYFNRMEKFARETDIDGVMLDEACFAGKEFCGCEHCRKAFTQHTGCVLPQDNTSKVFHDKNNPLWVAWLNWRKRAVGDWWVAMRKVFNLVKPDFCIMIYTTHYGFSNHWAPNSLGADITQYARGCDFIGTEIMARNVYDLYRPVFAFRKAKSVLGDHFGIPIWGLVYHVDDPHFAYFGWAMNHMNRQTSWMSFIEGEDMARYLDWPDRMKSRFAKPLSDVAILFSTAARDFGKMMGSIPDALGASQCLTNAHIQHDFVMDDDLLDARKLNRYKLLILASAGNLSAEQNMAIREYVESGGALFVTGHTSLLNQTGVMHKNFQLADVMGVDYFKPPMRGPYDIRAKADGTVFTFPNAVMRLKARKGAEVIAEILNARKNPIYPAIVHNTYGKGRCVYAAFQLGVVNYQTEQRSKGKEAFAGNPELADLLIRLARDAANTPFDVEAIEVPNKVVMSVCMQEAAGKKEALIHLLNATGAGVKKGEIIPWHKDWTKLGGPFPAIAKDLVFDIRLAGVIGGYIASPDYKGRRPISLDKRDNGCLRVTVKKEDLKAYGIVYLALGTLKGN